MLILKTNFIKNCGFSLIEVLVGIVLLAVALLAIAGMYMTSIKGNSFSSSMMQASFHGQDGLETLKSLAMPGGVWPASLSVGQHNFGQTPGDADSLIPGTQYSRVYTVSQHPTLPTIRIIQVTVNWTDTTNHTVSFSTTRASLL
jgi:prepilin-type N-terminal cleavage/methylation domain-containing protein